MDLSIVKRKLESKSKDGECYAAPEGFVTDVRLIFFNCAKYYKVITYFQNKNELLLVRFSVPS